MTPIHEVLSRIRWDADFGRGQFAIGFYDRIEDRILVVPLQGAMLSGLNRGVLEWVNAEGQTQHVPLHRIREVYKEGRLIWSRPHSQL